jgi:hypothetical protein
MLGLRASMRASTASISSTGEISFERIADASSAALVQAQLSIFRKHLSAVSAGRGVLRFAAGLDGDALLRDAEGGSLEGELGAVVRHRYRTTGLTGFSFWRLPARLPYLALGEADLLHEPGAVVIEVLLDDLAVPPVSDG